MNFFKNLSLFALLLAWALPAGAADQPSPFSSPEEKRQILELAGRDGQIDRDEWEANAPETGHFKFLTWNSLQNFDLDGDGLIGLNEFYKYIDNRARAVAAGDGEGTSSRRTEDNLSARRALAERSAIDGEKPADFDRRILYRRAQIAKRTKFQQSTTLAEEVEKARARIQHLRTITERRRAAAADLEYGSLDSGTRDRLRNLYKSRLVRNRIDGAQEGEPGTSLSRHRQRFLQETRASQQVDDSNRRRNAVLDQRRNAVRQEDANRRRAAAQPPSRHDTARQPQDRVRARDTSDIRALIPAARQGGSSAGREKRQDASSKKADRSSRTSTNPRR